MGCVADDGSPRFLWGHKILDSVFASKVQARADDLQRTVGGDNLSWADFNGAHT
jgi:hypothetical protein